LIAGSTEFIRGRFAIGRMKDEHADTFAVLLDQLQRWRDRRFPGRNGMLDGLATHGLRVDVKAHRRKIAGQGGDITHRDIFGALAGPDQLAGRRSFGNLKTRVAGT
jgi:hypothetical protein